MRKLTIEEALQTPCIKFVINPESPEFKKTRFNPKDYSVYAISIDEELHQSWWENKEDYDWAKRETTCIRYHYEEIELIYNFTSQQSVWEYLFSGGVVFKELYAYFMSAGTLYCRKFDSHSWEKAGLINFSDYQEWKPYIEKEREKEWWELNDNQPTLCCVRDYEDSDNSVMFIVIHDNVGFKCIISGRTWKYAEPVTKDIEKYIYRKK